MTIEFIDTQGNYIKQWQNWPEALIPQIRDEVVLHFGDYNEEAVSYFVCARVIDGTKTKIITIVLTPKKV